MLNDATRAISADQSEQEHLIPLAALMVQVDVEHDSEQRVELAIGLADRFQAALIGEIRRPSFAQEKLAGSFKGGAPFDLPQRAALGVPSPFENRIG